MPSAGVVVLFDGVGVMAASFDDAGVAAVPAWSVQVAVCGDVLVERSEEVGELVRGKRPRDR
jgi:hypothetical protein